MGHVYFDGFVRVGAVLLSIGVGEAGPRVLIAGPDRGEPGGTDGESSSGVEVQD